MPGAGKSSDVSRGGSRLGGSPAKARVVTSGGRLEAEPSETPWQRSTKSGRIYAQMSQVWNARL
jgi:hypothetical protein